MNVREKVGTMNINVICIGKLKERYWQDAVKEYSKRLGSYCTLQIIELKESSLRANPSVADEQAVKEAEGREILRRIKDGDHVITLEIKGKSFSSEQLLFPSLPQLSFSSALLRFPSSRQLSFSSWQPLFPS